MAILKTEELANELVKLAKNSSLEETKVSRNVLVGSAVNIVSALSASLVSSGNETELEISNIKILVSS